MENRDTDDNYKDKVLQLMIENKVLECEKKKAETEVEVWKSKCSQLQLRVIELEKALASKCHYCLPDTPLANTPLKHSLGVDGGQYGTSIEAELNDRSRARKCLTFAREGSPSKKIAPCTPAGVRPAVFGVIDIDDTDDDEDDKKTIQLHSPTPIVQERDVDCHSTDSGVERALEENELPPNSNSRKTLGGLSNEDSGVGYDGNISFISTWRKKRFCNIVTSDGESDDNDDVPISRLKNKRRKVQKTEFHLDRHHRTNTDSGDGVGESSNGHCLRRLRKSGEKSVHMKSTAGNVIGRCSKYHLGIPTDETVQNDDEEEKGYSDSDGDSLDEFIVSDSGVSESHASDGDGATESEDTPPSSDFSSDSENALDDKVDYRDIISRIRRNRAQKVQWEFEADMLAAFGKDPELCMRAVCALYRQQTSAEKFVKGTLVQNGRGFSQCDALRGSKLAEFLLDGDPQGDLKKSVEELRKYDPKGVGVCGQLATRYSKQLFEIYKSKEDPFFLAS